MTKITMIAAHDLNYGIGLKEGLPWSCAEDMKHFKEMTTGHVVIMGRNTQKSFLGGYLRNRYNIVLSSTKTNNPYVWEAESVDLVMERANQIAIERNCDIFVIGGAKTYEAFKDLYTDLVLTEIPLTTQADTFLPKFARTCQGFALDVEACKKIQTNLGEISINHYRKI